LALSAAAATDLKARKQFAALVGLTQARVGLEDWYLQEGEEVSVLWNSAALDAYCDALTEDGDDATNILLNIADDKTFRAAKRQLLEALPAITREANEERPLSAGFEDNLQYFQLDFLDPTSVELGREFSKLLPTLWMMTGCVGPIPSGNPDEAFLFPEQNPFAILLKQTCFRSFKRELKKQAHLLSKVFLVTDSTDAFQAMRSEVCELTGLDTGDVIQLYRSYLDNFRINTGNA